MTKKNKKKGKKNNQTHLVSKQLAPLDPWLSTQSEYTLLQSTSDEVSFYSKDDKIFLILPITIMVSDTEILLDTPTTYPNNQTKVNQRFELEDPNLGFYLIHMGASASNIEKVIEAHNHFLPDQKPFVTQSIGLDSTLTIERKADPNGLIQKKLLTTQLYFLGHSILSYAVMRGNQLVLIALLKNNADPNQSRQCLEIQKNIFLNINKSVIKKQIKFINSLSFGIFQNHIKLSSSDVFMITVPDLSVSLHYKEQNITLERCKVFYNIHEDKCTFSGFRRLEDGGINEHPENIMNVDQSCVTKIVGKHIIIESQNDITIFLRLGSLGLHWFDQMSPLHIASNNTNAPIVKALMLYGANPFYKPFGIVQSPIELAIENETHMLLPAFYDQLKLFDLQRKENIVEHLIENGHLSVAYATIVVHANLIDTNYLVNQYPLHMAIIVSQLEETQDQKCRVYLEKKHPSMDETIYEIMETANPEAISKIFLNNVGLIIDFWKKYPPTDKQLQVFIDWCIENKHTLPLEIIIVKLKKHLTLDSYVEVHDRLKFQYPNDITFIANEAKVIHGQAQIIENISAKEIISERTIKLDIQNIIYEIGLVFEKIPKDIPKHMSYRKWFEITFLQSQINDQVKKLNLYEENIDEYHFKIEKILGKIKPKLASIKTLLENYHTAEDHEASLLLGKLTEDLKESHRPIISLFDEIHETDQFAISVENTLCTFRDELKTTLICNPAFFIKQFFIILKNALLEINSTDPIKKAQNNHIMDMVNIVIVISTYHVEDLKFSDKDTLCDQICTWVFKERKDSKKIFNWIEHFFEQINTLCKLETKDGLSQSSIVFLTLSLTPKKNMIRKFSKYLKKLIEKRDILDLKNVNLSILPKETQAEFIDYYQLELKSIIITLNDMVALIPLFIFDHGFEMIAQEHFEEIKFALYGIQLTNQSAMNHRIISLKDSDLCYRPQFIISIFDILDELNSVFDFFCDASNTNPLPK